jgi:hypothetical protein
MGDMSGGGDWSCPPGEKSPARGFGLPLRNDHSAECEYKPCSRRFDNGPKNKRYCSPKCGLAARKEEEAKRA